LHDIQRQLDQFWAELPEDWVETATLAPGFSLERLHAVLARFDGANSLFGMVTK